MMVYWDLFVVFFYTNIIGFGGGPATIPLLEKEVVQNYGWMTTEQFSQTVALANTLPGPIITKLAGYVGYTEAGVVGVMITVFASVIPSVCMTILLLNTINKFRESPRVSRLSTYVLPTIAVLMAQLSFSFLQASINSNGLIIAIVGVLVCYVLLDYFKMNTILLIVLGFVFGGLFLR